MADQIDFAFGFAPFAGYVPYSGEGGSDLFPQDGLYAVKIGNLRPYFTKDNKYPALKVSGAAVDDDAQGLRVIDDVMCGGKDKKGEDLGRQFIELLLSMGTSIESIHANAQRGVQAPISQIVGQLKDKVAYAEIERDVYDGKEVSHVKNWVTKERYEQAKTIGAHRRKPRAVQAGPAAMPGAIVAAGANGTAAQVSSSALPML